MPVQPPNERIIFKTPSAAAIRSTEFDRFRRFLNKRFNLQLDDYWMVHAFSIDRMNDFWVAIWEFMTIIGSRSDLLFDSSYPMDVPNPNMIRAELNYAENLLLSHVNARSKTALAIISVVEPDASGDKNSTFIRSLTYDQLYIEVRNVSRALTKMGIVAGDRIVAFSPNNAEAAIAALAASTIGAVWSSCPPEFGVNAVLERFTQIEPTVLFSADQYRYAGKTISIYEKLETILASLPSVKEVVITGHLDLSREPKRLPSAKKGTKFSSWNDIIKVGKGEAGGDLINFRRASAMTVVYILYSSGTTGKPKAIKHGAGALILSQKKSNALHSNSTGAAIVLYDGSPLSPMSILWDLVDLHKVTTLGISPRYLQALLTSKYYPNQKHDLKSLDIIATTGSPLKPELYTWIRDNIADIWINNGTGGTDICGVFVATSQVLPIYYGELQVPALGMAISSYDEAGKPVLNEQGNLVITKPFPNMPLGFLNDEGGARYKSAYFEEFTTPCWTQGDWIEISSVTGGTVVFGRSDGVLNPSGVRFGSAELYDVVEEMKDIVEDCIAVGQKIENGHDERVILFIKPKVELTSEVLTRIKKSISVALSPRHVPAVIVECPIIPYTTNGKKLEIACKKLVNGIPLSKINISAAEAPESLQFFIDHPALRLTGNENGARSKL